MIRHDGLLFSLESPDIETMARDLFTVLAAFLDQGPINKERFNTPWLASARDLAAEAARIHAAHGDRYDWPCSIAKGDYPGRDPLPISLDTPHSDPF